MAAMSGSHLLMCTPRFYGVEYVINPWMEGNVGRARREQATAEWHGLERVLSTHATVDLVDGASGLPDMPFSANAGLVHEDLFVPSRFRFAERQPEVAHFTDWFQRRRFRIVELPGQVTFEGEGDALFQPGQALIWGGYGVRTSLQAYRHLAELLDVEIVPLRLVDERFYHLDTCFCPLPNGRVVYYPGAFDRESLEAIATRTTPEQRIEVDAADALAFACNALVVGRTFVANAASPSLRAQLGKWGYDVVTTPVGEFLLAGGGVKCLTLHMGHPGTPRPAGRRPTTAVRDRVVEVQGHLLDSGLINRLLDTITEGGGTFEIEALQAGLRRDQGSCARLRVVAPSAGRLDPILTQLLSLGARVIDDEVDARLETCAKPGVAPLDFYATTIFPTEVRLHGTWVRAERQRMDAVLVVEEGTDGPHVRCRLLRDLAAGDRVVCGIDGVRTHPTPARNGSDGFGFMGAAVSSERRVEVAVERIAWEMRRVRARGGRIVVVGGPVVIHTGGAPYLASLIRRGYVQAVLGGNGFAVHDIEQSLFGTSLGVDLKRGIAVPGGHRHHLRAINVVRNAGGIAPAVAAGTVTSGIMYECVRAGVPFALAGSIRDDGPLPDTLMDLVAAQAAYARLVEGADMILSVASMLHSIGVGNMTPAGVRLICVDISPAVVTKLADRGSVESTGVVTDVGLFLAQLDARLGAAA
jgi:lysine-ketoglutarate reductase/saccharopine dehydrogenase-like protein (TIGR00300 family)